MIFPLYCRHCKIQNYLGRGINVITQSSSSAQVITLSTILVTKASIFDWKGHVNLYMSAKYLYHIQTSVRKLSIFNIILPYFPQLLNGVVAINKPYLYIANVDIKKNKYEDITHPSPQVWFFCRSFSKEFPLSRWSLRKPWMTCFD